MELFLKDLINKESGKIGIVVGLGPSLNNNLKQLEQISKSNQDKYVFFTCNLFDLMTEIQTNYWLVCNPQRRMFIENYYNNYNSQKKATLFFCKMVDPNSLQNAKEKLTINYIDFMNEKNLISEQFKLYTDINENFYDYKGDKNVGVHTVVIHLIALATIVGCKEIYISGVDLDYSKGFVTNGIHDDGVRLGQTFMKEKEKKETLQQIQFLNNNCKKIGTKLYALNNEMSICEFLEIKSLC